MPAITSTGPLAGSRSGNSQSHRLGRSGDPFAASSLFLAGDQRETVAPRSLARHSQASQKYRDGLVDRHSGFVIGRVPRAIETAGAGFLPAGVGHSLPPHSSDPAIGPSIAKVGVQFSRSAPADWLSVGRVSARRRAYALPHRDFLNREEVGLGLISEHSPALLHVLTRRLGAFANARISFGELRNV